MNLQSLIVSVGLLLISCGSGFAWNQSAPKSVAIVAPPVTIFEKGEYEGDRQNWDVSGSVSGIVYFANNSGLLRYDGESWSLFKTKNTLRAVHCWNDTIYVGGNGLLGYFLEKELHKGFQPLAQISGDIWNIYRMNNLVVFQSFSRVYYLGSDGVVGSERIAGGNTTFTCRIGNEIFYQVNYDKIRAFTPNRNERVVADLPDLKQLMIRYIDRLGGDTLLVGTLDHGLFLLIQNRLVPLNSDLNDFLKANQLNRVVKIDDKQYAFATMNGGLIIGSTKGEVSVVLNRSNGLSNNRVHSIFLHKERFLWVATDSGISLVDLKDPVLYIRDRFNEFGSFYDVVLFNNVYYAATNQGLYRFSRIKGDIPAYDIELLSGSEGLIWTLKVIDGKLWIGHNDGTFLLEESKLKRISGVAGGYKFVQSKKDPNIVYQSSYYSVAVYKKMNSLWQLHFIVPKVEELIKDLFEMNDGSLIAGNGKNALYQIIPDIAGRAAQVSRLELPLKASEADWLRVFEFQDKLLVTSADTSFFLKDHQQIQACLPQLNRASYLSGVFNDHLFVLRNGELSLLNQATEKGVALSFDMQNIQSDLVFKYEQIALPDSQTVMFCLHDRIAFTTLSRLQQAERAKEQPSIVEVTCSDNRTGETDTYTEGEVIPFKYNTLKFLFTAFRYGSSSSYEYMLEGYNNKWQRRNEPHVVFQDLHEGHYTFLIREFGSTAVDRVSFTIAPPYYRSKLAYVLYLITLVGLAFLARYGIGLLKRRRSYVKLQKIRKKLTDMRLQNTRRELGLEVKHLQEEVIHKSDKVTNLLLQNSKKREVIDKINEELRHIRDNHRVVSGHHIEKLAKMIKSNSDDRKNWLAFEAAITDEHANFFKKLRTQYIQLTDEDLKLCAYIKANLTSREIAPILNITPRSVDLKKYRLKKKLNLDRDQSLKQFVLDFE